MTTARPIAHVRFDTNNNPIEHWLDDHLRDVAELAAQYARAFQSEQWADSAGVWHDLGKYNPEFQSYIRDKTGYERENAHVESVGKVNHSAAGALYAVEKHKHIGRALAYLIAGHHAGLPDWRREDAEGSSLEEILGQKEHLAKARAVSIPADILNAKLPATPPKGQSADYALWLRMLFSCLVDADFLDTERFMQEDKFNQRGQYPNLDQLLLRFNQHMTAFAAQAADTRQISIIAIGHDAHADALCFQCNQCINQRGRIEIKRGDINLLLRLQQVGRDRRVEAALACFLWRTGRLSKVNLVEAGGRGLWRQR